MKSMIYTLKGANDPAPRLSHCDMENTIGYDDPTMETLIGFGIPAECMEYEILDDATRNFEYGAGGYCDDSDFSDPSADWKGPGWYRMMSPAGTKMLDVAVPSHKCGTYATGWLNGTHPDLLGETVDRTACFNWDGNECNSSTSVKVKNCGGYFLYYLPAYPHCRLRYCAE